MNSCQGLNTSSSIYSHIDLTGQTSCWHNVTSFSIISYCRISGITFQLKNVTNIQSRDKDIHVSAQSFQILLFHISASQVETKKLIILFPGGSSAYPLHLELKLWSDKEIKSR